MFLLASNALRAHIPLVIIIAGFLLLSCTGLFYGFGMATAVNDETPPFVAALKMIGDQTLRPAYPTFYYLPVAAYAELPFALAAVLLLPLLGLASTPDAIREFIILDFAKLLPAARIGSMVYGALAIWVLYRIALRFFTRRIALAAAFLLSTSLLFVQLAHVGRVWTLQAFVILLALWAALSLEHGALTRRYLYAAFAIACAFGINMVGALAYVPFVVAHILRMRGRSLVAMFFERHFLFAHGVLFLAVCAFYYLNPHGFANYIGYIQGFLNTLGDGNAAHVLLGESARWCGERSVDGVTFYLKVLIRYELPLLLFAALGTILLSRRGWDGRKHEVAILSSFTVSYVIGITLLAALGVTNCEERYILPAIPMLAFVGAWGLLGLFDHFHKQYHLMLAAGVLVLVLTGPILFDLRFAEIPTRQAAREWVIANIPSDAKIVSIDEKLELPENIGTLEHINAFAPGRMTLKRSYLRMHPEKIIRPAYELHIPALGVPQKEMDFDYLILTWRDPDDRAAQLEKLSVFKTEGSTQLLMRFPDEADETTTSIDLSNNQGSLWSLYVHRPTGPVVDIYKLTH